jgi:hypothetical protein
VTIEYDVLRKSYSFTISDNGEIFGLVAGDHGYEPTGIILNDETIEIWKAGVAANDKREMIE